MTGPLFEELETVLISLLLKQEHQKNVLDVFSVSPFIDVVTARRSKANWLLRRDFRNYVWIKRDSLKFITVKSFAINLCSFPLMN